MENISADFNPLKNYLPGFEKVNAVVQEISDSIDSFVDASSNLPNLLSTRSGTSRIGWGGTLMAAQGTRSGGDETKNRSETEWGTLIVGFLAGFAVTYAALYFLKGRNNLVAGAIESAGGKSSLSLAEPITLFGHSASQNVYKIDLACSMLGIKKTSIEVPIFRKVAERGAAFLRCNPQGKVPTVLIGDQVATQSNAILLHLGERTRKMIPQDPIAREKVYEWLFREADEFQSISRARLLTKFAPKLAKEGEVEGLLKQGNKTLTLLDQHLVGKSFIVGEELTLADISIYAQTSVAHEGGFVLDTYPNIQTWMSKIEGLEGYIKMAA